MPLPGEAWVHRVPAGAPGRGLLLHGWLCLLLGDSRVFLALPWCVREVTVGVGLPGGVSGEAASHLTHQPLSWM